ncbi:ankyrin repeat domain-containing protein 54 [Pocillopora verrucosa]|uniref:ankyrin repeat domain-containing protein 54 n=1 Tax=Pocillopora verrucosa TaxID=203993 RepID=UPI00333F05D0
MATRTEDGNSKGMVRKGKELWKALRNNPIDKERVNELLSNGAPPNFRDPDKTQTNWTPLHFVVNDREGDMELVKMLLEHGAETNLGDSFDLTPLHLAAEKGYSETVETFLNNPHSPADRTKTSHGKETALDIVERRLREERTEDALLIELKKVVSHLQNDQVADYLFVDGLSSLTINVPPASPVNLNVETARLLVVGDHNTTRNDDRN